MRVLPEDLRDVLNKPYGQLVDEKQLIEILKKEKYVVSVGDMVTYTILKYEIEPIFCIVDYKTRRGALSEDIIEKIKSYGKKSIVVENPPASISDDLWNIIEMAYENLPGDPLRIEIKGEEDLASLAAIYMAPPDVTIIYGLPNKGVLVIKPTPEIKSEVKDILDKM